MNLRSIKQSLFGALFLTIPLLGYAQTFEARIVNKGTLAVSSPSGNYAYGAVEIRETSGTDIPQSTHVMTNMNIAICIPTSTSKDIQGFQSFSNGAFIAASAADYTPSSLFSTPSSGDIGHDATTYTLTINSIAYDIRSMTMDASSLTFNSNMVQNEWVEVTQFIMSATSETLDSVIICDVNATWANASPSALNAPNITFNGSSNNLSDDPEDFSPIFFQNGLWTNGSGTDYAPNSSDGSTDMILDTIVSLPSGGVAVNNLTLETGTELTVGSGNTFEVNGTATNAVGTGGFEVEADNSDYGQYIGPAIAGTFQQYVGNSEGWRHLGWPVDGDASTLSGVTVNYTSNASTANMYSFNTSTFAWDAVSSSSTTPGANGVSLYTGGTNFPVTNGTLIWTGTSNNSAASATYNYNSNPVGDASFDGWNLIANPYPCNIDWHTIDDQQSGVFSTYSIYDPNTNSYATYSASGGSTGSFTASQYIAPGQSVWVKTSTGDDGKSISVANSDRSSSGGNTFVGNFKSSSSGKGLFDRIKLDVRSKTTGFNDALVVIFPALSNEAFDSRYDGHKPTNLSPFPNFYSKASTGEGLAINGYGAFDASKVVPVSFVSDQFETYEIGLEMNDIDLSWGEIYLVDTYAHKIHNLTKDGLYSFTHSQTAPADRFEIRFSISIGTDEPFSNSDHINIYSYENTVAISRPNPSGELDVVLYSITGQVVYKGTFGSEKLIEFDTNLPKAYYIVKAQDQNGDQHSQKVILQ